MFTCVPENKIFFIFHYYDANIYIFRYVFTIRRKNVWKMIVFTFKNASNKKLKQEKVLHGGRSYVFTLSI